MLDVHVGMALPEVPAEPLGDVHGAVEPAGAADGDGHLGLAGGLELPHHEVHEVEEFPEELTRDGRFLDVLGHFLHAAAPVLVFLHVEGIRQEAHVDDHVRVDGDAVLEPEGEDGDLHVFPVAADAEAAREELEHVGDFHARGVDDEVRESADGREHPALFLDAFLQAALPGEGMAAAGLHVAPHEHFVGRFEEDELVGDAALRELVQRLRERVEEGAAPDVRDDRHAAHTGGGLPAQVREAHDEHGGQIVHAVVPHLFQLLHEARLARAAHARDDHEAETVVIFLQVHSEPPPLLRRLHCSTRSHTGPPPSPRGRRSPPRRTTATGPAWTRRSENCRRS